MLQYGAKIVLSNVEAGGCICVQPDVKPSLSCPNMVDAWSSASCGRTPGSTRCALPRGWRYGGRRLPLCSEKGLLPGDALKLAACGGTVRRFL